MRLSVLKLTLAMTLGAILLISGSRSNATPLSVSGTICTNFNAGDVLDIDYFTHGVRNLNVNTRAVICALPRQPLPGNFNTGAFTVSGSNSNGSTTSGIVSSFNQSGAFLGSANFSSANASYLVTVSFPVAQLPTLGFMSTFVTLPASGAGVFRGVTINQ